MKICLPCPGLEHIQRGYETYTRELFHALKGKCDVQLVKSSGKRENQVHVIPAIRRTSRIFNLIPKHYKTDYRRFQVECWTFALAMLPLLLKEKFDLIHFSEAPLGDALKWIRGRFGFKYRLLLSNGGPWPPWDCARFDAVHQVSSAHHKTGREGGLPEYSTFLVPYGTDASRLDPLLCGGRHAARLHFDLPENKFIVISLTALNSYHKRVDWLIKEFANLGDDAFLVMAGNREEETQSLEELAAELLPYKNYRFMQLPYEEVPTLLHAADVMVQCSLEEGFGRVLTEAMGAGTPLLTHPYKTAKWILDNLDCLVDMTIEGELTSRLRSLKTSREICTKLANKNKESFKRFEWNTLVPDYMSMYNKVILIDIR